MSKISLDAHQTKAEDLPEFEDWQYEVENKTTVLGFWEWLEHKKESEAN